MNELIVTACRALDLDDAPYDSPRRFGKSSNRTYETLQSACGVLGSLAQTGISQFNDRVVANELLDVLLETLRHLDSLPDRKFFSRRSSDQKFDDFDLNVRVDSLAKAFRNNGREEDVPPVFFAEYQDSDSNSN